VIRRDSESVALGSFLYRGEAEVARARLDSHGIPAYVRADDEGGLNPGFFRDYRVVLVVPADRAAEALTILGAMAGGDLEMPAQVVGAMMQHSRWAVPHEACGLLAGSDAQIRMVFCLSNRDASATSYTIDPGEYFGAIRYAGRFGCEIVGAWHSHPDGLAELSPTDIASSPGGRWVTAVVGLGEPAGSSVRAFRTDGNLVVQVPIVGR